MVGLKTIVSHCLLVLSIVLAARDVDADETAVPSVAIHFSFDRPADASMAPFFMAAKDGKFGAEHLNVSFTSAAGSREALGRVATGNSEFALVDINELIRFRDKTDAPPVKAVFVLFNRAPYAIVARKSRGIHLPYGFAVVANPAFAMAKPDALKGFVRALIAGINATAKEPLRAADEAAGRIDDGDRDLELTRLRTVLADNILTDEVRRNGLGGLDPARLDRSIDQIAEDFRFRKRPAAGDIFDGRFLPPVESRLIN